MKITTCLSNLCLLTSLLISCYADGEHEVDVPQGEAATLQTDKNDVISGRSYGGSGYTNGYGHGGDYGYGGYGGGGHNYGYHGAQPHYYPVPSKKLHVDLGLPLVVGGLGLGLGVGALKGLLLGAILGKKKHHLINYNGGYGYGDIGYGGYSGYGGYGGYGSYSGGYDPLHY
ncbi:hypothetical protein CHUAL_002246 [Chamberlinius hualienensis]